MKLQLTFGVVLCCAGLTHAQDVQSEKTVGNKLASEMAAAAVEDCSSKGYNTVAVVVDRSGYMKAMARADNARPHAIDIAYRKAHTSAMLGYETSRLAENIQAGRTPASILNTPNFTSLLGGFPIKLGNEVIGGMGVSGAPGGEFDAACVATAFKKVEARLK